MWRCIYFPIYFMGISEIASYVSLPSTGMFFASWPLELWLQCFEFSGPKNGSKNSSPEMNFLGQMVSSAFFWFQENLIYNPSNWISGKMTWGNFRKSYCFFVFGVKILSFLRTTLVLLKLRSCSLIFENTSVGCPSLMKSETWRNWLLGILYACDTRHPAKKSA